jgi:hypothetical protein
LRQQRDDREIRMLGGGTWVEQEILWLGGAAQQWSNQREQQREDVKVVGSIVLLWWEDMGHVEASDWLVWRASLRTEGGVALVDKMALMEVGVVVSKKLSVGTVLACAVKYMLVLWV